MISLKEILSIKKLNVFDFDGTLVNTDSKVYVTHSNATKSKLDADEFNKYKTKSGDKFDYSEFFDLDYLINPKLIKSVFNKFKNSIRDKKSKTIILTNRKNTIGIRNYFNKKLKLSGFDIIGTGIPNPSGKYNILKSMIEKYGFNHIEIYDDSSSNLNVLKKLENVIPNITINVHKV